MVSLGGNPKLSESRIGADSTDDADYRMSDDGGDGGNWEELSELELMGFTDFQDYRTFLLENCPL